MNDKLFLMWLHARLAEIHKENECTDYMHKLRAIIRATPEEQYTPNKNICNSLAELKKDM